MYNVFWSSAYSRAYHIIKEKPAKVTLVALSPARWPALYIAFLETEHMLVNSQQKFEEMFFRTFISRELPQGPTF